MRSRSTISAAGATSAWPSASTSRSCAGWCRAVPRSCAPRSTLAAPERTRVRSSTGLAEILAGDERQSPARGEAVKVGLPEEELLIARRRIERLVSDAGISDPSALDDANLASAVDLLASEEREVSSARGDVIRVLDTLQDELKRRYREDPTLVLS